MGKYEKKTIHNLSIKEGSLYVFVMLRSPKRPTSHAGYRAIFVN